MPRQKLGQHFLNSQPVLERIAKAACAIGQPVIEIGPGKGSLTGHLLARASHVIAIELDPAMIDHLRARFPNEPRLEIVQADALDVDFTHWGPAAITGNLPYYVATPILEKVAPQGGVFLIQKEVAERITAKPGRKAYGYLTVKLALYATAELLFAVKPGAFRPPPKVDSAVIHLTPNSKAAELEIVDSTGFLEFVSACFHRKRKTIRNNLIDKNFKVKLESIPETGMRAEQLSLIQLAELYHRLRKMVSDSV